MRNFILFAFLIGQMIVMSSPAECSVNLIKNPGFETGDISEWGRWAISGDLSKSVKHGKGDYSYGPSLEFDGEGALIQEITSGFSPGEKLEASAWIKTEKISNKAFLKIEFFNEKGCISSIESEKLTGTKDWTKVVISSPAVPEGTKTIKCLLQLSGKKDEKGAYFDDVYVATQPPLYCMELEAGLKRVPVVSAKASSSEPKNEATGEVFTPEVAFDGKANTRWSSNFRDGEWIEADLGEPKVIEKVILTWESAYGETYQIQVSEDGINWYVAQNAAKQKGGKNEFTFPPVAARYVRMYGISRGTAWGFSLYEFEILGSEGKTPAPLTGLKKPEEIIYTSADLSPKAYYAYAAANSPKGYYPKWMRNEQAYWTIVGSADSEREALLCEDGMIDFYENGFSLMPYLYIDNKLISAEDVKAVRQSLEEGYLPIPAVEWDNGNLSFNQKLFSHTAAGNSSVCIWYSLQNKGKAPVSGKLFLTVRPFQVNPSWMFGGFVEIPNVECSGDAIKVNGKNGLVSLGKPDNSGAVSYEEGDVIDAIKNGAVPKKAKAESVSKFCSAAMGFNFTIKPGQAKEFMFIVPVDEDINNFKPDVDKKTFVTAYEQSKNDWKESLNRVKISIPQQEIINVFRSNLAYILINKDKAGFKPGSRNYNRTWMRDGATMAEAVMRTGHLQEAKEYVDWVTTFQEQNGRVPPIIYTENGGYVAQQDKNLNEYDAQGEYVFAVAEYYRFTKDQEFLKAKFPHVLDDLKYMEELRKARLTDDFKNASGDKKRYYGILPESISHEGYSAPGKHSYWDDFWGLKGFKDAEYLARGLGKDDLIPQMKEEEEDFRKCLLTSIELSQKDKNIKYIPGCAELGDFDATSTAISVWPTKESEYLSQESLFFTLDKYYNETFLPRLKEGLKSAYTPYEIRTANAYLILGEKEKALAMLNYFLTDMRPRSWNHWGEVVHPGYREPKYVGDMPHTWEGAIYINFVRNLFAYENNDRLILAAGVDSKWLESPEGITVIDLPTHYGKISYSVKKEEDGINYKVWGDAVCPAGIILKSPVNSEEIKIDKLPAEGKIW